MKQELRHTTTREGVWDGEGHRSPVAEKWIARQSTAIEEGIAWLDSV
jgi:hypothetical protein